VVQTLHIRTTAKVDFRDITSEIQGAVHELNVQSGVCHVFVPHTTTGLTINEHADPNVTRDIAAQLDSIVPQHGHYQHTEGNAPAHIKASLIGSSVTVFVEEQRLVLGTWQGIFLCEFDGPRQRTVLVKVTQG
jgi:secondary thiamine-phosphate synthase enzyme